MRILPDICESGFQLRGDFHFTTYHIRKGNLEHQDVQRASTPPWLSESPGVHREGIKRGSTFIAALRAPLIKSVGRLQARNRASFLERYDMAAHSLARRRHGLAAAFVAYLCVCAYFLGSGLKTCLPQHDPAFATYYVVWGPVLVFFLTIPLMAIGFAAGYFGPLEIRRNAWRLWLLALLMVSAVVGYAVPSTACSPL